MTSLYPFLYTLPLLLGIHLMYITSKNAVLDQKVHKYELNLIKHNSFMRYSYLGLISLSVLTVFPFWGLINGFILWMLTSILILSLLLIMTPLKLFNFKVMGVVFVLFSIMYASLCP